MKPVLAKEHDACQAWSRKGSPQEDLRWGRFRKHLHSPLKSASYKMENPRYRCALRRSTRNEGEVPSMQRKRFVKEVLMKKQLHPSRLQHASSKRTEWNQKRDTTWYMQSWNMMRYLLAIPTARRERWHHTRRRRTLVYATVKDSAPCDLFIIWIPTIHRTFLGPR